ncbi:choice-of-anchor R domain-containing protein [Maridesulfovibrio sp.]|uniref:choice-of-anchor R domain-containing protein n=1 Tax=Maridesulfovibrio sp. TaxID=2795000 RepID=UPI003BAA8383
MTVVSSRNTITFAGDGVQSFFDFNFRIFRAEDLCAVLRNGEGREERLMLGSDFKIVSGVGSYSGGRAQYPISGEPLPVGQSITFYREIAYTQELELVDNDPFSAQLLNEAFDRGVMRDQQLQEQVDRALKYDISTPVEERFTPQEMVQTITNARDEAVVARSGAQEAEGNAWGMLVDAQVAQNGSEAARDTALLAQSAAEDARDSAIQIAVGDLSPLRSSPPVLSAPAEAPEGTTVLIVITDHTDDGITSYEINTFGFGSISISGNTISWVLESIAADVTKSIEVIRRRRGELYSDTATHKMLVKDIPVQDGATMVFTDSTAGYPGATVDSASIHAPAHSAVGDNPHQIVSAKPEILQTSGKLVILDGTTESVLRLATLVASGDVIITDKGEAVVASVEASGDPSTLLLDTFEGARDDGLRLHGSYSPGGTQFTPTKNYTVDTVTLKAGASVNTDAQCSVAIFSDNNGVPGVNLSGYGPVVLPVANQLCEMSVPAVELTAGTKYWAMVQNTGTNYTAFWSNPDATSPPSYRATGMSGVWAMKVMSSPTVEYAATLVQPLTGVPTKAVKKQPMQIRVGAGAVGEYLGPKKALSLKSGASSDAKIVVESHESIKDKYFGGLHKHLLIGGQLVEVEFVEEAQTPITESTAARGWGGVAFGPLTDADGVECAIVVALGDARVQRAWGATGTDVSQLDNVVASGGVDSHTGVYNTGIQAGLECAAASYCEAFTLEGKADWFLPNRQELADIVSNHALIDAEDDSTSNKFSSLVGEYIWSSSEQGADTAYRYRPDGYNDGQTKTVSHWVIPCRRIPIAEFTKTVVTITLKTALAQAPTDATEIAIPNRCTLTPDSYTHAFDGDDLKITGTEIALEDNPNIKRLAMAVSGDGVTFKGGKIYIKEKL